MSNTLLESPAENLSYKNIRYCPVTIEHPFDKNVSYTHQNWVQLVDSNEQFWDEEALLLCPHSEVEWVTWLPSQGETILHIDQICRLF